ncbi:MAG: hypothetical protein IKU25_00475 [Clostridia bacterium]|nr:hypothetical protein [Clostridia bacterium]MBR5271860.1 hypothetical protein [Clostridia bacterium]
MDVNFKHQEAAKQEPIRIEQVFAEKPGGGLVENPTFDAPATTAVGEKDGKFALIKAYRLVAAVASGDTTISIAKGSGVAEGDVIATGKKGVACTKVDTSAEDKDVVTVTLGVDIPNGKVLYQAKAADASNAEPLLTPVYVTGNYVYANQGDQGVRLINGANLRKETANIASEVAALLPMIQLV